MGSPIGFAAAAHLLLCWGGAFGAVSNRHSLLDWLTSLHFGGDVLFESLLRFGFDQRHHSPQAYDLTISSTIVYISPFVASTVLNKISPVLPAPALLIKPPNFSQSHVY